MSSRNWIISLLLFFLFTACAGKKGTEPDQRTDRESVRPGKDADNGKEGTEDSQKPDSGREDWADPEKRNWLQYPIRITKHARCRMDCRNIDMKDIQEALKSGKINYRKSEKGRDKKCPMKYAIEHFTSDGQEVRIVVGACETENVIITVIDLGKKRDFNCPNDCK